MLLLIVLVALCFWDGQAVVYIFVLLTLLVSVAAFGLLGYAAVQVVGLVREVRGEVQTLVGTAQDTFAEVEGTARFVNDQVVSPLTRALGFVSATRATVKAFTEPLYKRKG